MSSMLENVFTGGQARDRGTDFEKMIGDTFEAYAADRIAYIDFMPLPMTPCGIRHPLTKAPLYIPKGKAPFDVYGFAPRFIMCWPPGTVDRSKAIPVTTDREFAIMIGAECKASGDRESSMPIVKPGKHASGIAFHQLDALALLARLGGIARIIWNNCGEVGVLKEDKIVHHHAVYAQSLASEVAGKGKGTHGSRSIPWEAFEAATHRPIGGKVVIDWLQLGGDHIPPG